MIFSVAVEIKKYVLELRWVTAEKLVMMFLDDDEGRFENEYKIQSINDLLPIIKYQTEKMHKLKLLDDIDDEEISTFFMQAWSLRIQLLSIHQKKKID